MSTEEKDELLDQLVDITEEDTLDFSAEPKPEPKKRKSTKKKSKPCADCPDYDDEDLLVAKVLMFKSKGYNNSQIASLLRVPKAYVDQLK